MAATDKLFAGSIPDVYDRLLVPLIFESYARDLAGRLASVRPRDVLETAAGTGALTRAIEPRLDADARMVATDLNQPMLDRAARQLHAGQIAWRQADAMDLPFADGRFDAVACQFGVMFFPDKVRGYREVHRVLKPGGHFFFNVWDKLSENEFADVVTQALATHFPRDPPRFLAYAARLQRCRANPRGVGGGRIFKDFGRDGGWSQQGLLATRTCDRLLPGNAVAQ
jgi:ubiquinone/menaquinone biosynthesis C-methylase UbiE